jgi:hypothetical protein
MDVASPTMNRSQSLDTPPMRPPGGTTGKLAGTPSPAPGGGDNLGDLAGSPQLMTMQGLAMVKDGFQFIANGRPELAQLLSNTISDLEQLVVQSTAAEMAGQQQQVVPPPGVAPMMTPPPGGPMQGGPPQGGPPMGGGPGPMPGM